MSAMSKHEYTSNEYVAFIIASYCKHPSRIGKGKHNLRNVEQKGDNVYLKIGSLNCKIEVKGMVKDNPNHYFSRYELSEKRNLIEPELKNLTLNIKRSRSGRASGVYLDNYPKYIDDICFHSDAIHKKLEEKLKSKQ